ncbi:MAG: hypothetical protein EXS30_00390 [Pedosphaera sp.]|nr:hypothetical protein [Pedosphaera sp.]
MSNSSSRTSSFVYFIAMLGAFLIVAGLVQLMKHYTAPTGLNTVRIAERRKALAETATASQQLNGYSVIDPNKGLYQLRIDQAMETIVRESKNPAASRSNMVARVEKAFAPPPKAPEKPSQFE